MIIRGKSYPTHERGDTLIEVMMAIAVLALVVTGCMTVMNQTNRTMLDAIGRTSVRTQINNQSDLLTYLRDVSRTKSDPSTKVWEALQKMTLSDVALAEKPCTVSEKSFVITKVAASYGVQRVTTGQNTSGQPAIAGDGVWIDAVRYTSGVPYTDFYIKACWRAVSGAQTEQTSTIVRLYDK